MSFNYSHLNANGANTVSPNPCALHSVTINTKGAAANVLTLADGATTLAVIDTVAPLGPVLLYDVQCKTGLTATLATGTAADVTIAFG